MANMKAKIRQSMELQEQYLKSINAQLISMPEGSLYQIRKSDNRYFFQNIYKSGARIRMYLGVDVGKQAGLISDLKRKRFLIASKKILEGNVVVLRACLKKYEEFDPAHISSRLAATYENIKETTGGTTTKNAREIAAETGREASRTQRHQQHQGQQQQYQQGDYEAQNTQAEEWQNAPYPRAEMHEENLKHEAIGGLMVRSKSEALIAFALDLAHIPFHYEEILELESKKIAPDFTILHPLTGERIYWEHIGMMDDTVYAAEAQRKLILYGQNGILPGKNLIFTMETNMEPLSIREIQCVIKHYLLD